MERLSSVLTMQTAKEAIGIAIITMIIGNIAFYLTTERQENEDKQVKKNKIIKLNIILFITGFLLHFIIETVGLNKWYCDKCIP